MTERFQIVLMDTSVTRAIREAASSDSWDDFMDMVRAGDILLGGEDGPALTEDHVNAVLKGSIQ